MVYPVPRVRIPLSLPLNSIHTICINWYVDAGVLELVDKADSKSAIERFVGSSPSTRTIALA